MNKIERFFRDDDTSYFLFGPRGTGKTTWLNAVCGDGYRIDLLNAETRLSLMSNPQRLRGIVEGNAGKSVFVIDEIQKVPALLDVVHGLMENYPEKRFILTGSSARKLKREGVDLLGARALERHLHPFMAAELGAAFSLDEALETGLIPVVGRYANRRKSLSAYLNLYIREEVEQEGLVRNLESFSRFLEAISFSHGSILSVTEISRECGVKRTTVDGFVSILEDLLIAFTLPVFSKRSKRKLVAHEKFYFFDAGVFRTIRPKGPLDRPEEIDGAALEGLVCQHLRAWADYSGYENAVSFWRTQTGDEVDFIVYTDDEFVAIEVKNTAKPSHADFNSLKLFGKDYPMARRILLYRGKEQYLEQGVLVMPADKFLMTLLPGRRFEAISSARF